MTYRTAPAVPAPPYRSLWAERARRAAARQLRYAPSYLAVGAALAVPYASSPLTRAGSIVIPVAVLVLSALLLMALCCFASNLHVRRSRPARAWLAALLFAVPFSIASAAQFPHPCGYAPPSPEPVRKARVVPGVLGIPTAHLRMRRAAPGARP